MDTALYSKQKKSKGQNAQMLGSVLYRLFDESSHCLQAQMRQAGAENLEFREQLERLAIGEFSVNDWESWKTQGIIQILHQQ